MSDDADIAEQFEKHLNSPKQTWLLGAGVSFSANIPLMHPLTERVLHIANTVNFADDDRGRLIVEFIRNDVSEHAHIEHILTHLADLISLAERSRTAGVTMNGQQVSKVELTRVHETLLSIISDVIRWGYRPPTVDENGAITSPESIGKRGDSIVTIDDHMKFIRAVFGSGRAGIDYLRSPVEFFTTNYDTLLEDALALGLIPYQDGFNGGGVGFWTRDGYTPHSDTRAIVTKLHGSIDWYRPGRTSTKLLRIRDGDSYPNPGGAVMIYPQATKYLTAQRDPFSGLFQRFRNTLTHGTDQVLLICGYSFGDEHINAEIEAAMSPPTNQLTILAFSNEVNSVLPETLQRWRSTEPWQNQLFIASPKGLYQGSVGPIFQITGQSRDWWTFSGATKLFSEGLPKDIQDAIQ